MKNKNSGFFFCIFIITINLHFAFVSRCVVQNDLWHTLNSFFNVCVKCHRVHLGCSTQGFVSQPPPKNSREFNLLILLKYGDAQIAEPKLYTSYISMSHPKVEKLTFPRYVRKKEILSVRAWEWLHDHLRCCDLKAKINVFKNKS